MEDLLALAKYVTPNRLKRLAFYGGSTKEMNGMLARFHQDLSEGKFATDTEACNAYFSKSNDQRYRRLKARLTTLLSNAILLIDVDAKRLGGVYENDLELRKQLSVAQILWYDGQYKGAAIILERYLPLALKEEATVYLVTALPQLRFHAYHYLKNPQKFETYEALFQKWNWVRNAEQDIRSIYERLSVSYSLSTIPDRAALTNLLNDALIRHLQQFEGVDTAYYIMQFHLLKVVDALNRIDYRKVVATCWEAIERLKEKEQTRRAYISVFLLQIPINAIRFDDFQQSRRAILEYIRLSDEGSMAWFSILRVYYYVCLQSEQYQEAVRVNNQVFNHKNFKRQPQEMKERFYLLRIYLNWLVKAGVADTGSLVIDAFRFTRFYNDIVTFSQDRQGVNIPKLIIRILWYITVDELNTAWRFIENLDRYHSRHLRNAASLRRTYYFVRIVLQIEKASFNSAVFVRQTEKLYETLRSHTRPSEQQSFEVEIIPYERLYSQIVALLKSKE